MMMIIIVLMNVFILIHLSKSWTPFHPMMSLLIFCLLTDLLIM
jgi:hypothetical protein